MQIDSNEDVLGVEEEEGEGGRSSEPVHTAIAAKKKPSNDVSKEEILEDNPWLSTFSYSSSSAATRPIAVPSATTLGSNLIQNHKWTKVESTNSKKKKAAEISESTLPLPSSGGNSADVAASKSSAKGRKNEAMKDKEIPNKKSIPPPPPPNTEKSTTAPNADTAKTAVTVRAPLLMQKSQVRIRLG